MAGLLPGAVIPPAQAAEPGASSPRAQSAAFQLAEGRRTWAFPRDHGQHPQFRLEWWYYTGLLKSADGRTYGFQVTFFRRGIVPGRPARGSAWAVASLYAAQAALSLPAEGRFLHDGTSARDSLGLAGAAADAQRVWVGRWRAEPLEDDPHGVRLSVPAQGFTLELVLHDKREGFARPPVLHGEGGLDRKGDPVGQASWYYSLPRLRVEGRVTAGGAPIPVSGTAWMDHEFSSSQLNADQAGWDWFGLRLTDGSDWMLYRLRRRDGSVDPHSGGTAVSPDGRTEPIALGPGRPGVLEPTGWWKSEATGARYPVSWRIALPEQALALAVRPLMEAQELTPTVGIPFAYWEGAVRVEGMHAGRPVTGEGYLELTGYGGELGSSLR